MKPRDNPAALNPNGNEVTGTSIGDINNEFPVGYNIVTRAS
jgi:hypothetical protein